MVEEAALLPSTGLTDPGWEHGVAQDEKKKKVKCNYCGKVVSGGIYRLKQHLARIAGEVTYCTKAPEDVFIKMKENLANYKASRRRRQLENEGHVFDSNDDDLDDLEALGQKRKPRRDGDCRTMVPSGATLRALGFVDPGWEHGVALDETKKKVKCNYCEKVVSGGINRFKQHLARIPGEVAPCRLAPQEVYLKMKENMKWHRNSRRRRMETKELAEFYVDSEDNYEEEVANGRSKRSRLSGNQDTSCSKDVKRKCRGRSRAADSSGTDIHGVQMNLDPLFAKKQKRSLLVSGKQARQKGAPDKKGHKEVISAVCKFFCYAAIPFDVADSSYFRKLLDLVAVHGPVLKGPASKSLAGRYLQDEVKTTKKYYTEIKASWGSTGCTIIADSWKNLEGKTIINFSVSCPRGTYFISSVDASHRVNDAQGIFKLMDEVVDEVGEENVIQVITENSECYKTAGKMLEEKRRSLFWMPSATDCIDQILEDFMKIKVVKECIDKGQIITRYIYNCSWLLNLMKNEFTEGKELVVPSMRKAATTFLTLQSLVDHRAALKKLFQSNKWRLSEMSKSIACKEVERIVLDLAFWKKMLYVRRSVEPIVEILKKLDSNGNLSMPSIYNDMYQAKLSVKTVHGDDERLYGPFLEVIDRHWDAVFDHPLYVAAYFLNPAYRYQSGFNAFPEVIRGLNECITRLESDNGNRVSAATQISEFVFAKADFGTELALSTRMDLHPAAWWQQHGISCLELQRIAIRILSQTCTTLGCEHYWSTFDQIHSTRRNHLGRKRQEDLTSVHYNLRLQERQSKRTGDGSATLDILMLENLLEGWIVDKPKSLEIVEVLQGETVQEPSENEMNGNEDLDLASGPSHENITTLLEMVEFGEVNPSPVAAGDKDGADDSFVDDESSD